ncbi:hypothetical protein D9758_005740 [Tetrapyrgos nigripes]|uniref:Uncharacterized protein n=1 Tax=Tetrapyrgos nigripes TaxID=182062 RepID=A0A8H5LR12_9AGAR|nr:hypothetical protein D9758_005740 [Tetrapyrgos nigripes]
MSNLAELYRGLGSSDVPMLSRPPHIRSYLSDMDNMNTEERQAALAYQSSLFYVLSALFHQCIYRARLKYQAQTQDTLSPPDFLTSVNVVSTPKGIVDLPPTYFPNNVLGTYSSFQHDLLANGPLWRIAKQLHDMIRSVFTTTNEIKQTIHWVAAQPDKRQITSVFRHGNGSLMMSSLAKFNMHGGTEFVEGEKPLIVYPFTSMSFVDGMGLVLPTEERGTGALDVYMVLSKPLWEILEGDEQLRRFSSEWSGK